MTNQTPSSSDDPKPQVADYGLHPQLYYSNYDEYLRIYNQYRKDYYEWAKRRNLSEDDCGCS